MSWKRAVRRTFSLSRGTPSQARKLWSSTSKSWKPRESPCLQPRPSRSSGMNIFKIPVSSKSFNPMEGRRESKILQNSSRKRSVEMLAIFFSVSSSKISENVRFSILNSSCDANLIARIGRKPSSMKRSCAFPTVRMVFVLMSSRPQKDRLCARRGGSPPSRSS